MRGIRYTMEKSNKKQKGILHFLNWKNVSIGLKYFTAFIATALLFIIASTFVYFQFSSVKNNMEYYEEVDGFVKDIEQLSDFAQTKDVQVADYIITGNVKYVNEFKATQKKFDEVAARIEKELSTERLQNTFQSIIKNDDDMNRLFESIMNESNLDQMEQRMATVRERSNELRILTIESIKSLNDLVNDTQQDALNGAFASLDKSAYSLIIAVIAAIVVGSLLILFISRRVTNYLSEIVNLTSEIADGNLSVESIDYDGRDEIGQMAKAVNQMKENIQAIIQNITTASESVSSSSEELTQSSNEVKVASEQMASTMQEIASGTETQANSATQLAEHMGNFVGMIQTSEEQGNEVRESSSEVVQLTEDGNTLMDTAIGQMETIDQIVSESVKQVQGLDEQSAEISQLVNVIQDIAEQTNLLALNAAIEAARAGEHGQGFAVVADEVRKLAEQVSSSVHEITNIVNNIQAETNHVVESLHEGYKEVREGTTLIEKTGDSFTKIDHAISDMVEKITTISGNLKNIVENGQYMNGLIEDIASVSEESAAGVEQATASSQQTSSAMDEISYNAEQLSQLAEEMNEEIGAFRL